MLQPIMEGPDVRSLGWRKVPAAGGASSNGHGILGVALMGTGTS